MRFNILCDIDWETKIDEALNDFSITELDEHFKKYSFGNGLAGITIVLMCKKPELKFKQRIRLSKNENKLYMDIMLAYDEFIKIEKNKRKEIISNKILTELPLTLKKYKIEDFNRETLILSLKDFFTKTNWISKNGA